MAASLDELVKEINAIKIDLGTVASEDGIGVIIRKAQLCNNLAAAVGKATDYVQLGTAAVVATAPAVAFPKTRVAGKEVMHGFWETFAPVGLFLAAVATANYMTTRASDDPEKQELQAVNNKLVYTATYAVSIVVAMKGLAMVRENLIRDGQAVAKALFSTANNIMT